MEPAAPSPSSFQDDEKSKFPLLEPDHTNIAHVPSIHTQLLVCKVPATPEDIAIISHLIHISRIESKFLRLSDSLTSLSKRTNIIQADLQAQHEVAQLKLLNRRIIHTDLT